MTSIQKIRVYTDMGTLAAAVGLFIALQSSNIYMAAVAGMFFGGNATLWLVGEILEKLT